MNDLLSLTTAARIANRDASVLRKAAAKGSLVAAKYGNSWVVSRADLQAWINNPAMHIRGAKAKL